MARQVFMKAFTLEAVRPLGSVDGTSRSASGLASFLGRWAKIQGSFRDRKLWTLLSHTPP
jgi:hypothetical protein